MRDTHALPKTVVIHEPSTFFKILTNEAYDWEHSSFDFLCDGEKVIMELREHPDLVRRENLTTNEVVGAFTTAYGRIKLFCDMNEVGFDNVLYHDTDSLFVVENQDNAHLFQHKSRGGILGTELGDMSDELPEGQHITEMVCLAPKTYACRLTDGSVIVKNKGLSLNYAASQKVNFDAMREIALNNGKIEVEFDSLRKTRKKTAYDMRTVSEKKTLQFSDGCGHRASYDKGYLQSSDRGGHVVLPWGHCDIPPSKRRKFE